MSAPSAANFAGERVLVTGGAGFIGSHLVAALVARGAVVRVLDDLSNGKEENLEPIRDRIEVVRGDIRDAEICQRAVERVRTVFHLAALGSVPRSIHDPATSFAVNVGGTVNVFAAARRAEADRVVYASSSSVYGDSAALPKREGEEGEPLSPYALSKSVDEQLAAVFGRCYGMGFVGLRYFNVYGPRQDPDGPYAAVIPRFFKACLTGGPPVIFGDGTQSRDFTFVDDAVDATLLAAKAPLEACGRAYNVAGGSRTTVNELARRVGEAVGGGLEPRYEPSRAGDVQHSLADLDHSAKALGFRPRVGVAEGLERSAAHYRSLFGPSAAQTAGRGVTS